MYYLIGSIIFILLIFSTFFKNYEKNTTILFLIISILFLLSSIRYEIGTDYSVYYKFFNNVQPFSFDYDYDSGYNSFEPLFKYIVVILKNVIASPLFYFSLWSFITLSFFYFGIKENSAHYILSLFILYCIFYHHYLFNTIRQGVVMGIFIYSLKYILNREFFKILMITIFSSLIHTSGILIMVGYYASFIKFKTRFSIILSLFISIGIWKTGLGETIFEFIAIQFQPIVPNLYMYVKLFFYEHNFSQILQRILLLVPLIYYYNLLSDDDKYVKLFSIYLIGVIIYFSFGFFGLFITRINMFFRILEIILIPILYQRLKNKNQKLVMQLCVMIWGFVIMTWLYFKDAYYPFKTIFGSLF